MLLQENTNEVAKPVQLDLELKKAKKPYVKETTKRILHALGNGLRTATSIANALGMTKDKIQSNLWHLKDRGLIYGEKKAGSNEYKYWLTTDKPVLDQYDITPKKKARKPYTKRATKVITALNALAEEAHDAKYLKDLEKKVVEQAQRLSDLELCLVNKDKEVWSLECEVFDKKAVIKYLEGMLFVTGVK